MTHPSQHHYNQARASLQQALSWFASFRRHWNHPPNVELQAAVRQDLQVLKSALDKLDQNVIRIAAFGLVSRGKSAVVNALLGQKVLPTGPIHGVTQWPKSIRWTPPSGKVQIELIDTPGLDEIAGQARADMAREVARQADLILFVVAGDITRSEYQALAELRQSHRPLILVFNKIDLYPERDREAIYRQLQQLGRGSAEAPLLSPDEIVRVAAEPQPLPVRVEWGDGKVTQAWESPPPQIEELRQKVLQILNWEGRSLLAFNALVQARNAEVKIAQKTLDLRQAEAEALIWKYSKYKALAVAANPIAVLDILGGFVTDLALIRALARLYGLPITNYEAGKLWRKVLTSSGGSILAEIGSSVLLGVGKSAAVASALESPTVITTYASTAAIQGAIAGYGAYAVGQVAKEYLKAGCTWGPLGPSTVIQEILNTIDPNTILYRLRQELGPL
ncbi:MAG: GTP-binding protein [Cyanophyceae cyanobacterium]